MTIAYHRGKVLAAIGLAMLLVVLMAAYTQSNNKKLTPSCDCIYAPTHDYGVIKNGQCVPTKCMRDDSARSHPAYRCAPCK
jgi:hypothetical protein